MAIIRTTYSQRLAQLRTNNMRLGRDLARAQEEASTGLRVSRASDDAGLTTRLAQLREQQDDQQVYADNAEWAMGILDVADGALTDLAGALSEATSLAVQMSNETYTNAERQRAANVAAGILDRVLQSANATFGDRYIFAGDAYDAAAFDATGAYQGDAGEPDVPVGEGTDAQIGWDGSDLLQGTNDIIGAFSSLVANLTTGTSVAVRSSIDDLDLALDQLSEARSRVANEFIVAEDAKDLTVSLDLQLTAQLSADTEVDAAESYARLFEVQAAFEAALQVTAQSRSNLLFTRI